MAQYICCTNVKTRIQIPSAHDNGSYLWWPLEFLTQDGEARDPQNKQTSKIRLAK